ncbi:hypothetical protein CQ018_18935 [Arthrobacter sp. MYb227]|nr:hypothetical protein CQ018_18935 [Arthrobacter sp. MYb227]
MNPGKFEAVLTEIHWICTNKLSRDVQTPESVIILCFSWFVILGLPVAGGLGSKLTDDYAK